MRLNSPLLLEHEILGERVQQRQRDKRKTGESRHLSA